MRTAKVMWTLLFLGSLWGMAGFPLPESFPVSYEFTWFLLRAMFFGPLLWASAEAPGEMDREHKFHTKSARWLNERKQFHERRQKEETEAIIREIRIKLAR